MATQSYRAIIEAAAIHEASCRYRKQGLVCSTCSDTAERAERAARAIAAQQRLEQVA
jgi:hypothetical protein